MPSRWRADAGRRVTHALPWAAVAVAEGSWVTVVHAAIAVGIMGRPAGAGILLFALAAGAGLAVARRGADAPAERRNQNLLVVVGAALVGWLADGAVLAALGSGDLAAAVAANPSGVLLAVAAWRGMRYRSAADADAVVARLLGWGIPGLAIPWLFGSASPATAQAFAAEALPATLLFVAGGLTAIGLLRLDALSRAAGVEWSGRREWPLIIGGVAVLVLVLGIPAAILLDVPLGALARSVAAPFIALGGALAGAIEALLPEGPPPVSPGGPPGPGPEIGGALIGGLAVFIVLGAAVAGLAAMALVGRGAGSRRPPVVVPPDEPVEVRRIELPRPSLRLPGLRLPRRVGDRARPRTAGEAYAMVVAARAGDPATERRPSETPAGHARRLRREGRGALALDLLAADYALEHYAGTRLSDRETHRAIARWRRLRNGWSGGRGRTGR